MGVSKNMGRVCIVPCPGLLRAIFCGLISYYVVDCFPRCRPMLFDNNTIENFLRLKIKGFAENALSGAFSRQPLSAMARKTKWQAKQSKPIQLTKTKCSMSNQKRIPNTFDSKKTKSMWELRVTLLDFELSSETESESEECATEEMVDIEMIDLLLEERRFAHIMDKTGRLTLTMPNRGNHGQMK